MIAAIVKLALSWRSSMLLLLLADDVAVMVGSGHVIAHICAASTASHSSHAAHAAHSAHPAHASHWARSLLVIVSASVVSATMVRVGIFHPFPSIGTVGSWLRVVILAVLLILLVLLLINWILIMMLVGVIATTIFSVSSSIALIVRLLLIVILFSSCFSMGPAV